MLAIATMLDDQFALAHHYLAFGDGYTIWMDAGVALAIPLVCVLAYELARRHLQVQEG